MLQDVKAEVNATLLARHVVGRGLGIGSERDGGDMCLPVLRGPPRPLPVGVSRLLGHTQACSGAVHRRHARIALALARKLPEAFLAAVAGLLGRDFPSCRSDSDDGSDGVSADLCGPACLRAARMPCGLQCPYGGALGTHPGQCRTPAAYRSGPCRLLEFFAACRVDAIRGAPGSPTGTRRIWSRCVWMLQWKETAKEAKSLAR